MATWEGFDRFYGFLEGETDQFHPDLVRDNHSVQPPGKPEDGYHLSEDIVDNLLRMIADSKELDLIDHFCLPPFGVTMLPIKPLRII